MTTEMTLADIERLEALAEKVCAGGSDAAVREAWKFYLSELAWPERILALCALARRSLAQEQQNVANDTPRGEIVAWLETEPGVTLEQIQHPMAGMFLSTIWHVGECPTKTKPDNCLFPLYAASPNMSQQVAPTQPLTGAGAVVPMELHCPFCHEQHIDEGEWATRPHKTHLCAYCEHQWRPANIPTVGVRSIVEAALAAKHCK